jgi:methylation protein EvaC
MINYCRISGDKLIKFLDLGRQPMGNGFLNSKKKFNREFFYNLRVGFSKKSSMVQLLKAPKKEKMFNNNYAFYSSTSKYMDNHFKKFSKEIKNFILKKKIKNPLIVEIGSNDGITLKRFKKYQHLGIEPARNVALVCKKNTKCNVMVEFFSKKTLDKIFRKFNKKVDVYYSTNVIGHIEDIKSVFKNISQSLSDKGILVLEDPYLGEIIKKNSYDQIYDEHIYFFSLTSISKLAKMYNLELFDASPQSTHGGSMRYFICKNNTYKKTLRAKKLFNDEKKLKLEKLNTYRLFAKRILNSRIKLVNLLKKLKKNNKTVYAYGATAKSTTIFNFCKIDEKLVNLYFDNTKIKQNKFSPGMHIKVKSFKELNKIPDYYFLSAWNHKDEIFKKEKSFIEKGGKWITHVPFVKVI